MLAVLAGCAADSPVVLWSDDGPLDRPLDHAGCVAAVGFGLFGLLDDLAGSTARRGFRGHVGALRQGELTTGLLKLVGGGLVAVVVAWPVGRGLRCPTWSPPPWSSPSPPTSPTSSTGRPAGSGRSASWPSSCWR